MCKSGQPLCGVPVPGERSLRGRCCQVVLQLARAPLPLPDLVEPSKVARVFPGRNRLVQGVGDFVSEELCERQNSCTAKTQQST